MSRLTRRHPPTMPFAYGAITRYGCPFQGILLEHYRLFVTGLFRVRSPLLTESRLISFPLGTEMFQFPRFASYTYEFSVRYSKKSRFPHSDIFGSTFACQLPEAYRRLLRPSSPLTAKASTICAYSLIHITLHDCRVI